MSVDYTGPVVVACRMLVHWTLHWLYAQSEVGMDHWNEVGVRPPGHNLGCYRLSAKRAEVGSANFSCVWTTVLHMNFDLYMAHRKLLHQEDIKHAWQPDSIFTCQGKDIMASAAIDGPKGPSTLRKVLAVLQFCMENSPSCCKDGVLSAIVYPWASDFWAQYHGCYPCMERSPASSFLSCTVFLATPVLWWHMLQELSSVGIQYKSFSLSVLSCNLTNQDPHSFQPPPPEWKLC